MIFYDVTETIPGTLNGISADGITDDTLNLKLYINYVYSLGGGTLVLPGNKTILISSQLTIYDNLTFKSSHGKTTLKAKGNGVYSFMNCSTNANSITLDSIVFDAHYNNSTHAVILKGDANAAIKDRDANVTITNCTFKNFIHGAQSVYIESIDNTTISNCTFDTVKGGIFYHKRNEHLRIKDNYFSNLKGHAIHLQGAKTEDHYCSDVIIEGNHIVIKVKTWKQTSKPLVEISPWELPERRLFAKPQDLDLVVDHEPPIPKRLGVHGIYMTCGDVNFSHESSHHENVVVANNTIIGPGLSYARGGSADLFSLKDIVRLKCYGNTARNSGDLGYAIERCHYGVVSNNTADQNNTCGISIFGSSHISVVGNVCTYNEQDHDHDNSKKLRSAPYGGIRVEFDSVHILITGNHFCGKGKNKRTQQYGIVVKEASVPIDDEYNPTRPPYNIKIGVNHYIENGLGDIYNEIVSTIIEDISAKVLNNS